MKVKQTLLGIFSVLIWTFFVLSCIFMFSIAFLIWLFTLSFDRRLKALHLFSSFWGSIYIWINPLWPARISGRRHIRRGAAYIMVSNHQSMLDILLLYGLFRHFKFLSKSENFHIPIIGWLMRLNRYPEITRGSKESKLKLFDDIGKILGEGSSVLVFPEGTRYPGGYLGPFMNGAFRMALDSRVPILPIVLDGTALALPKKGFVLPGRRKIRLRVLREIPYGDFKDMSVKEVTGMVREMMEHAYSDLQQETGVMVPGSKKDRPL
jgi:1-acyl-sn-glycerol-3-phosphate acyltransferase